jgi:hypothetical protein
MAANTAPIFCLTPRVEWGTLTSANTAKDGTGTVVTVFTAQANGSRIEKVKARALGTNVATVLRIFINNGSTNATAANNTLVMEWTLPATTLSEVAALTDQEVVLNLPLPAGYKVNVTIGTTVAAGYAVTGIGGDY